MRKIAFLLSLVLAFQTNSFALFYAEIPGLDRAGVFASGDLTVPCPSTQVMVSSGAGVWACGAGGGGSGTVTSVSVTTANGVSGSVATATTTPAITLTLGDITPTGVGAHNLNGTMTMAENTAVALDPAGSADGKWTGITIAGTGGTTIAVGDLVTLDKDNSRWELVDISVAAAVTGDARGLLGIAVSTSTNGTPLTVLLKGAIRADAVFPALTIGAPVYASTSADIVVTQPVTTDHVIRLVGSALTADEIYFDPDNTWTTHT